MMAGPTSNSYDFLLKFLIIGDSNCGKTCLLTRFLENKYKQPASHTIGVEFGSKIMSVGSHAVKLQVWDTAGQERFRSVTRSYYRGAAGALLVFDVTSRKSYDNIPRWLDDARSLASSDIVIVLVGNKSDLDASRVVTWNEASRFANSHDVLYVETSAVTGSGVEDIFLKCTTSIMAKIETGRIDPETMGSGIQFGSSSMPPRLLTDSHPNSLARSSASNRRSRSSCC
eukprot:Partr_v1_DN23773_c0_g1_i1_m52894 putative member RAS oncogene family